MDVWFGRADVSPTEANTDDGFVGTAGAIVYVFAQAPDSSEFESTVAAAFAEQDLDLDELEKVVSLAEHLENDWLGADLLEPALETAVRGGVHFGPFYTYESEDDEPEQDVGEALREGLRSGELVTLSRGVELTDVAGVVAGIGEEWVLVHTLDPAIVFDGYTAVLLEDVSEVEPLAHRETFQAPALNLRGEHSYPQPGIGLESTHSLLESVQERFPVFVIFQERHDPDVCYVGAVERVEEDSVFLRHVSTAARWEEVEGFLLADITRVDFGNRYEEALALVAGTVKRL